MKISIIILSKDKPEYIGPCLESLGSVLAGQSFEILLGDTGSSNPEVKSIYSEFEKKASNFKVFNLPFYHFSKNNNFLAEKAKGEIFLFLNNDTLAFENSFAEPFKILNDASVGIVGAKLLFGHNERVQHAGIEFVPNGKFKYLGFHPYRGRHSQMPDLNITKIMPAVTGACLFIKKELFEKINGFDENYASEAQDVDLCLKVQKLGYKCVYVPQAMFYHLENGTRVLGEENQADRALLIRKWQNFIDTKFLYNRFQSQSYSMDNIERLPVKYVLFQREIARGDVLASTAVIARYREKNPNAHITLKTRYPDLVDSIAEIDRVLHWDEIDTFTYEQEFNLTYENGQWQNYAHSWLSEMSRNINGEVGFIEFKFPIPRLSKLDEKFRLNFKKKWAGKKYIVVATGAGWKEREWSLEGWNRLSQLLKEKNYLVIQIGGNSDHWVKGAVHLLDRSLHENLSILENATAFVTLDSFPLHLAHITGTPTLLLTCKTCSNTIHLCKNVREFRNARATVTPLSACRFLGCRLKIGNGLDNKCSDPILKSLSAQAVMAELELIMRPT